MSSNPSNSNAWHPPPLLQAPVAVLGGHPAAWAAVRSEPRIAEPPPPMGPPSTHLSSDGRRLPATNGQHSTDGELPAANDLARIDGSPFGALQEPNPRPNPGASLFADIAGYGNQVAAGHGNDVAQPDAAAPSSSSSTRRYGEGRWEDLDKELRKAVLVERGQDLDLVQGQVERCQDLLERGANVNAKERASGRVPLHLAAQSGHLEIATKLIDWQADVNAKDSQGATPTDQGHYWYMKSHAIEKYMHLAEGCEAVLALLARNGGERSIEGEGFAGRMKQFNRLAMNQDLFQVGQQVQFPWLLPQFLALENGPSRLALPSYTTSPPPPPPRTGSSSTYSGGITPLRQADPLVPPAPPAATWRLPDRPVRVGNHIAQMDYDGERAAGVAVSGYLIFEKGAVLEIEERDVEPVPGDGYCEHGYYVYGRCQGRAGWFPVEAVLP